MFFSFHVHQKIKTSTSNEFSFVGFCSLILLDNPKRNPYFCKQDKLSSYQYGIIRELFQGRTYSGDRET